MTVPTPTVLSLAYAFFSIELITCAIVLAIACLNLVVICPTTLLHSNLKAILITQTVSVMLYVLGRSIMLFQKFVSNDTFAPANLVLQHFLTFDALFRRLLGHALIAERFAATVCTKYEQFPKLIFNFAWFSITFIIAFVNLLTNKQSWEFTKLNVITASISTPLSFIEYVMIILIVFYNRKIYSLQIEEASPNNYHIGQRFHLSNNMKIGKQLWPTFLCLFLSNAAMNLLFLAISLEVVKEQYQKSLLIAFGVWLDVIFGAAIELTVMTHHPLLKRRFATLLNKILCCYKNNQTVVCPNSLELAMASVNCEDSEMKTHFSMLQQMWNK